MSQIKKTNSLFLSLMLCLVMMVGCAKKPETEAQNNSEIKGKLVVYHAGSLTVPFSQIEKEFEAKYPQVDIQRTSGGSRSLAKKITDLDAKVDIFASADYAVIDDLVIPEHADWNALFASNSMVIMYTDKSKCANKINEKNWYEVILKDGVNYGHSEPNADPCGYRTVLSWQLAEKALNKKGLFDKLMKGCPKKNVRPKSVELISMLETGALDYAFEYESVARQHQQKNPAFKYVKLPKEINLSDMSQAKFYKLAKIDLAGKKPGQIKTVYGQPIVYGITMPKSGENNKAAIEFLKFFFAREGGLKVLEEQGQPVLEKLEFKKSNKLPKELSAFVGK